MGLIFTSLIYSLVFFLLTTKELITEKYDHDIDQFMYFGSRLLHGELLWTKEFDDKSPVLQYIFSLPAALKNTNIFVIITLIISFIATYLGYLMLKDILRNSDLKINKKNENSILYFGSILYLTLLACIYGSLHHINAISSSLCLITISITYLNKDKKSNLLTNISAITSAISISIRPYYLLNIIAIPTWLRLRERNFKARKQRGKKIIKYTKYLKDQTNWVLAIIFYIILFNLTPYLITGNLNDFLIGIKLNSIDYVNHNIFQRQYINIGRNPILYPILIGMTILPLIRIGFRKAIYNYYKRKENGLFNLYKLDIDIIFFGIINPILLEIMFYRKHFFGHYFTLFTPYILISIVLLLAIATRLNKIINNFHFLKHAIKIIFIMLFITCLITNQSLPNTVKEIFNNKITEKSYKLNLIEDFITQERIENKKLTFLAPNNNYIHWKLDESRHGFPQKAVFRNIVQGKMEDLINKNKSLNYKFLLPNKDKICETLNTNGPDYLITEKEDYSFNCMKKVTSEYKLISSTQRLNQNNIYIFKRLNH